MTSKFKISNKWDELHNRTRMTIEEDGDVGIGTTAPAERLDIDGNLNVEDSIKVEGELPIVIERFANVGGTGDYLTSYPISDYNAAISGFKGLNGTVSGYFYK